MGIVRIFHSGYSDCRCTFEQFSIRTAVQQVEHSRQQSVMDTFLMIIDITGVHTSMRMDCRGALQTVLDPKCCVTG